jgi:thiosulfate/3-mercaptopyruvate sulfurtransferase
MKKLLLVLFAATLVLIGCQEETTNNENTETNSVDYIKLEEFKSDLDSYKFVDVRSEEEYNGWNIEGLSQAGHIEGAVNFNAALLDQYKNDELAEFALLLNLFITDEIIVYGNADSDLDAMVEFLNYNGFKNVKKYNEGIQEYTDTDLPMAKLNNHHLLVSTRWVNDLIEGKEVLNAPAGDYLIFHAGWGNEEQSNYSKGHIPGSIHINTDDFETVNPEGSYDFAPLWNLKTDDEMIAAAASYGITTDKTVILYGQEAMAPSRIMLALRYLGFEDIRLVDGSYPKYENDGYTTSTESTLPTAVEQTGITAPMHPEFVASIEEVETKLGTDNFVLASVRSEDEHNGVTSGYNYINSMGRIPGDTLVKSGEGPYGMKYYRSLNGTMLSGNIIDANWAEQGIEKDSEIAFYCGTGWRAAETWFYAELLGYSNYRLYDGGWLEWSDYTGREIEGTLVPNE